MKTLSALLVAGFVAVAATAALAQEAPVPKPEVLVTPVPPLAAPTPAAATIDLEAGGSYEGLTNGRQSWNGQYLLGQLRSPGHVFYAQAENDTRFGSTEQRLTVGDSFPLGGTWTGLLETSYTPNHLILPAFSAAGGVEYGSGSGWVESLTLRHTDYTAQSVNTGAISAEYYWKNFRAAYALTTAQVNGAGPDVEHTFTFDTYYGASSSDIALSYTVGREVENDGGPALLVSHVDDWTLSGRHWLSARTALHYGLWVYIQGTSYTRTGGSLGIDIRL